MAQNDPVLTEGTNSYINYNDALTYFSNRYNSTAWYALSASDAIRVLISASAQISRQVKTAYKLANVATPANQELKDAVCELAIAMAADSAVIDQANTSKNVRRVQAGSATVEFFKPSKGSRFPSEVMRILQAGSMLDGVAVSTPVASGTTVCSSFDDADIYNRTSGFSS